MNYDNDYDLMMAQYSNANLLQIQQASIEAQAAMSGYDASSMAEWVNQIEEDQKKAFELEAAKRFYADELIAAEKKAEEEAAAQKKAEEGISTKEGRRRTAYSKKDQNQSDGDKVNYETSDILLYSAIGIIIFIIFILLIFFIRMIVSYYRGDKYKNLK